MPVVAAVVVVGWVVASRSFDTLHVAGAATATAIAAAALLTRRTSDLLAGSLTPLAAGVLLLALCDAGVATADASESWQPVLAVAAYPFLGKAVLELVMRHRRVREADVLVESALVCTAVGAVLHAGITSWRAQIFTSALSDAEGAFPAILVALDVALLVVAIRGLRAPGALRGPLGLVHVGLGAMLAAHLLQEVGVAHDRVGGAPITALAVVGLLGFAAAALHPAARIEPEPLLEEPPAFSAGHAGVVVAALLAAPTVLAVQAVRGQIVSATVATGACLSGIVLACYLVGLLHERAMTEHQATHDGLTHLPNRTLLIDRIDRSIAHARRNDRAVGVLFVDLDRFKEVNDSFGHAAGDSLLKAVANRLRDCVRDEDTVARLSGDEFVVLLPHLNATSEVLVVAERVLEALAHPFTVAEEHVLVAASVGIAVYPDDGATAEEVLGSADAAMYHAKVEVGSRIEVFSPKLLTQAQARRHMEAGLLDGLDRDELVLHYQPIIDVSTGQTVGAEALVRWNHPERGFLLPGHFVPLAEQSDLIVMLGDRVIHEACRELRHWEDLGITDRSISINVSARQFSRGLVDTIAAALRATRANPENLAIELTESTVVDNLDTVVGTLDELRSIGVRAAIDDFGTGYCGLRYLSTLPVAALKIDRSFIQGMTPSDAAIVGATIAMGHSLGLTIIAEGVETEEQRRFLTGQRCDRLQGYLLGRPMPASDLVDRLRAERAPVAPAVPLLEAIAAAPIAIAAR